LLFLEPDLGSGIKPWFMSAATSQRCLSWSSYNKLCMMHDLGHTCFQQWSRYVGWGSSLGAPKALWCFASFWPLVDHRIVMD
jgi:hypothetical protein